LREAQAQVGNITQYAPARTQAQLSRVSGLVNDFTSAMDKADALISASQGAAKIPRQSGYRDDKQYREFSCRNEGIAGI